MSYFQPPFNATSSVSDWPPFLEQAPPYDDLDANNQWFNEVLDSLLEDALMQEERAMTGFNTDFTFPQQNLFPANNHSMAAPQPHSDVAASTSSEIPTGTPAWMFQFGGMAGVTDRQQTDSLAAAATFGMGAPFGAGQWEAPQMVDQPMGLVPPTGATPFASLLDPIASIQNAQPGAGYASTPADAGEADLFRHQNACHLGSATFWCSSTGCNRSRSHPRGRPFPRKDKRNDHERKVHGGVLSRD
ncbi:hypothetical protein SLS58_003965 [Diplodia intermedia]|uniref:C2H2-type domain-containing protein n=1 Tax=Diplodia intermedia TaxID=856260 RepID=A0ABR3TVL7_9PEZI